MVEKEKVVICDDCKEKIAKYKCRLCEKDLCRDCLKEKKLFLGDNAFNWVHICSDCCQKLSNLMSGNTIQKSRENLDEDDKIEKIIIDRIKKNLILKNLEENEHKAEDS